MESSPYEKRLDQLIAQEKNLEPNPFQATRILQRIESEFLTKMFPVLPIWVKAIQPIGISLALATGILIGAYFGHTGQKNSEQVVSKSDLMEKLRADLYIPDVADEDNILKLNQ